jgi:hypothetical protein
MSRWKVFPLLLIVVAYVAVVDVCLLVHAPQTPYRSYSTLILGLFIQVASLCAMTFLLIAPSRYFGAVRKYIRNDVSRIVAIVGPVLFLWISVDMYATALYNRGMNNKLENARQVSAAFANCCPAAKVLNALR